MTRTDGEKSVTHVSDVNCHPCSGLNNWWAEVAGLMGVRLFGERSAQQSRA